MKQESGCFQEIDASYRSIMDSESSDADEGVENVGKNDRALTELQNSIQPERFDIL